MKIVALKYWLVAGILSFSGILHAQDLEYKMEIGGMLGGSFYLGDANYTGMFKDVSAMGGVAFRYNFNPRMALKANLAAAGISGTTKDSEYKIPGNPDIDFSRTLYDLGAQFEYNFFAYGKDGGYKRMHRLTPYLFLGLGFTYAGKPVDDVFALNFPLGAGVKYKLADRLNIGCELSFRFCMSDKLDVTSKTEPVLDDPLGIKSSGMKNKDSYSFFFLFLTYDIMPRYRKCNN